MTTGAHIRGLLAAAAIAVALAGCGDDDTGDPIPSGKARTLERQLDAAAENVSQDLCDDAQSSVAEARATADTLDEDGVGSDVQDALADGVDNLGNLVSAECEEPVETTPETTPEPTITETVPEPTTTETTPEPTTTEPTTPVPEPEPDESDGGAQFDPDALPPGQSDEDDE